MRISDWSSDVCSSDLFDWIKTNLPKKPKPASPPYQPEIAARAIHFAAHRRRKQIIVGFPSLKAIWTDRIASPVLDYYLAETGFSGQQANEPVEIGRASCRERVCQYV